MRDDLKTALAARLLAMADDELILGHRDAEWCGHAPILEEDIAFANLALDEIGHAILWYGLHAQVIRENPETYPDQLAYFRDASAFLNARVLELPKGDWAFSMLRQYLFDEYEKVNLDHLTRSTHQPLVDVAAKIRREEFYHLRHTAAWVRRLGLGTEESHSRMQIALDALWADMLGLFVPLDGDALLVEAGIIPDLGEVGSEWDGNIRQHLSESGLIVPGMHPAVKRTRHTEHLEALLVDLQQVARTLPGVKW